MNRYCISRWQQAVDSDDVDTVRKLLEEDQTHCVQCLQKFRPDGTWYLVDPLCEAARKNCIPVVQLMLDHGRHANYTYGLGQYSGEVDGAYCLAWAESEEMRKILIENGADPATIKGVTIPYLDEKPVPLEATANDLGLQWQVAIDERDTQSILALLSEHPGLSQQVVMERWRDGRIGHRSLDPLYIMAKEGGLDAVKRIIESGYPKSKLSDAIELAAPKVAGYLIDEQGVDANPNLGLMAYIGDTQSLKFWFDRGHKVHDRMLLDACGNRGRFRGFEHDAYTGWPEKFRETVHALIDAGADVNARMPSGNEKYDGCEPWRSNGESPLHFSAGNGIQCR